jgi:phage-related protein
VQLNFYGPVIGGEPADWKPMATIGQGVREIRVRDASGAFRIIYVAKFSDAVYVLHCFQKKTQQTAKGRPGSCRSTI